MKLVPLVDEASVDASDAATLEAGKAAFGKALNTWLAIANRPGLFATYLPFLRGVAGPGELDQRIKELTAVRVSVLNHCRYTASHRCTSAKAQGVAEDELAAVAAGKWGDFDERTRLALELTDAMTQDIASTGYEESPSLLDDDFAERLRAAFTPTALIELTMAISIWNALSRFHRVLDLDLDMPPAPREVAALL